MPPVSRRRALAYLAVVLMLLALGGRSFLGESAEEPAHEKPVALVSEPVPVRKLLVHVVGAVRAPGLYELPEESRVDDAIREAGGAKAKAALELVNLAAPVADGQQVVVPLRGQLTAAPTAGSPASSASSAGGKVHLNSATLEDLDALPGIGPVTAQKILDYRTAHGAFQSVDELDAVPGIGPARLAQLKPLVEL
jgi:competence protein ComEA